MANKAKGGKTNRKYGRSRRKMEARTKPMSQYVRDIIDAAEYFKRTKTVR